MSLLRGEPVTTSPSRPSFLLPHNPLTFSQTPIRFSFSLQAYYDAIKAEPFQYHQGADEMTEMFFNPDHKGWLVKEGVCVCVLSYNMKLWSLETFLSLL